MRKRNICSLVKSFVVKNQSGWPIAKTLIIIIVIVSALNLVSKFPKGPFINPLIINITPDPTSEIATTEDKNGDKPKYSTSPAGGKGNLK